jgi:O-antigen/teichoic acid export membrane protein
MSTILERDQGIHRNKFLSRVITMTGGTAVAQILPFLVTPVLARIYAPADFGDLATFAAMVSIGASLVTGQLELAIILPKATTKAAAVAFLGILVSLVVTVLVTLITVVVLFVIGDNFLWSIAKPLLPLTIIVVAIGRILGYRANRNALFGVVASSRVLQSLSTCSWQIIGGLLVGEGLIVGLIAGHVATLMFIGRRFGLFSGQGIRAPKVLLRRFPVWRLLSEYRQYPLLVTPAFFMQSAYFNAPVLLTSLLYSVESAGFVGLGLRMIGAPGLLIANSIGEVFRQEASQEYREGRSFRPLFIKTLWQTTLLAIVPFLLLISYAPDLFALLFGDVWTEAGEYARLLGVSAFASFVVTPLDKSALIVRAERYLFSIHLSKFLSYSLLAIIIPVFSLTLTAALSGMVIINVVGYAIELGANYKFSCRSPVVK